MQKDYFMYGLAGARDTYRVVANKRIDVNRYTTQYGKDEAAWMIMDNPSIEHVYIITMRPGLAYDYTRAFKENSIESWAIFKDILEREGNLVI